MIHLRPVGLHLTKHARTPILLQRVIANALREPLPSRSSRTRLDVRCALWGLETLRRIALALSVSADLLLFDKDERGPTDDLRLQFEAASRLDPDERTTVKELIEGMLLKHEAKRWAA